MKAASVGQLLLVGVPGPELDVKTAQLFRAIQPGGYILFGRNIKTAKQLRKLTDDLRDLSGEEPIITIDQEGGRVSRLRLIGNEPPNAQQLRRKGDVQLVREHGALTGQLLRLFGFNLDLCPVLDLSFDDEADNSLRGRCYGHTVEEVVRFAGAFDEALRATGVLSCGKHFPGYAAGSLDPHHELPTIGRTRRELDAAELAVFRAFSRRVSSMMVCHAWYPALDSERTLASLSRSVVTDLLRGEFGFNGLVMTDDLDMGAVLNEVGFDAAIRNAIEAGNDLAMICHRVSLASQAVAALESVSPKSLDRALDAVRRFRSALAPPVPFSETAFSDLDRRVWALRVAVLGEERARERSPEDGKRSPVEVY
ncbi:MAG: glycoside hydrolase family 3 protein [Verrucomicrobia bacterium]|nr:glycoside hydrolase family 3 protein [Verrucomicrobiota bacterium]